MLGLLQQLLWVSLKPGMAAVCLAREGDGGTGLPLGRHGSFLSHLRGSLGFALVRMLLELQIGIYL